MTPDMDHPYAPLSGIVAGRPHQTHEEVVARMRLMVHAAEMADLLLELRDYFADRADYDLIDGRHKPNVEGSKLTDIDTMLERIGRRPL